VTLNFRHRFDAELGGQKPKKRWLLLLQ